MGYLAGGPIASVNRTVTPGAAVADGQIYIPIPGGFQPGMTDVYVGGAMLVEGDYDDSDGMQIVLARGMALGTAYRVVSYNPFAQVQPVGGQLAGFRNLLINADGRVNQRAYASGAAVGAANTYTLDRWRVVTSGQSLAYALTSNAYTMTAPAGGVEQVIEGNNIFGGNYCLNWQGTATATVNGTAVAKRGVIALPTNTNATVRFIGGTFYLPQLEYGLVSTQFEQRPYADETRFSQRFYEVIASSVVYGCAATTTLVGGYVPFLVAKRNASYTFAFSNVSPTQPFGISVTPGSVAAYLNGCQLSASGSGLTVGNCYTVAMTVAINNEL